ncbi:hypothetical protein TTHERM_00105260 (macronuclear) [Tetrahymena thermophila SB210]|uniref:Leucine rich repeat protein n=1 Tax=Tetrahymena thermophila (strain SB210) TaxID=312017 RepID=Q234H2_TETTS|nr:hypothetical protein TTHERM_00105260 [Tetrahymena thermophila SB210]EAR92031.1 hypothetical protein TTHERM_00105260 [Tetrahymena thermophila SB210]|eukprot:XP_001012276.1 hypothetical protein TTHERM_00105260 [Tetrahymena thermophila SB210]
MSEQEIEAEEGQVVQPEEVDEEQDDIYPPEEEQRRLTHEILKKGLERIGKIWTGKNYALVNMNCEKKKIKNLFNILFEYPHLRQINFSNNWISDISTVTSIKYLTHLNLTNNFIENLDAFRVPDTLTFLEDLNLTGNKIKELVNIEAKNLQRLNLSSNEITTCENFTGHQSINVLILKKNKLKNLKGIQNMRNLEQIYAAENPITNFYDLNNLPHLKKLHLRKTEIKNLDTTKPQEVQKEEGEEGAEEENQQKEEKKRIILRPEQDQIEKELLKQMPHLPLLHYINLRETKVYDVKEVFLFQAFPNLTSINVLGTDLAESTEHSIKEELIMNNKQLKHINKEVVEEEEVTEALNKRKERDEELVRQYEEEQERLKAEEEERQRLLEEERERLLEEERQRKEEEAAAAQNQQQQDE